MIVANDATSWRHCCYPMMVKSTWRAQEVRAAEYATCIYLVDSGGAFRPAKTRCFPDREHFGRIFTTRRR